MNFKQNFESIDFSKIPFDKISLLSNTVHNLRLYSEYLYFKSEDLIDIHNKINKYNKINKIVRPIQFYRSSSYTITYTNLGSTVVHFSNLARSNKINVEKLKIQVQKKIEYIDNTIKVIIMKLEALKLSIPKEHTANLNSILRSVRQFNKIRSVIILVNAACSNINKVENLI